MADSVPPPALAPLDNNLRTLEEPEPLTLRGTETVFVVDDELRLLVVITKILREQGYTVLQAQTVGEATTVSDQYKGTIDLLLADIMLAKSTGPQLAAQLGLRRPAMKVLYMSGHPATSMLASAVVASGARFIQKPVLPDQLLRELRRALDVSRPRVLI
jgi:two-component system cell cycle sensor histidine kinase/response regulator CckA